MTYLRDDFDPSKSGLAVELGECYARCEVDAQRFRRQACRLCSRHRRASSSSNLVVNAVIWSHVGEVVWNRAHRAECLLKNKAQAATSPKLDWCKQLRYL